MKSKPVVHDTHDMNIDIVNNFNIELINVAIGIVVDMVIVNATLINNMCFKTCRICLTKGQWCELAEASLFIAKVINININIEFIININITWFANHVVWQALVAASLMVQQGVRAALPKKLRKRVQVLHLNRDYWVVTPPLSARAQVFFSYLMGLQVAACHLLQAVCMQNWRSLQLILQPTSEVDLVWDSTWGKSRELLTEFCNFKILIAKLVT